MPQALAALICATFLVAGWGLLPEPTAEWDNGEMSFRYPAAWTVWGPDEPMELLRPSVLAYLGNVPVDVEALCDRSGNSRSCDFAGYDMEPNGVVVSVIGWSLPGQQLPDSGEEAEVGGHAARFERTTTDRSTERLCWTIDTAGSLLSICGEIQGPGDDLLRDQVNALIDSFEFTDPG
jgi:hypothetical protein